MQPLKILLQFLDKNSNEDTYLYDFKALKNVLPDLSSGAMKVLLNRATHGNYITRVCRNIYAFRPEKYSQGLVLYHAAAHLRNDKFNYISLESSLSDLGIISQIPINRITIMSSGRSSIIDCGEFGTIEFIHTIKKPVDLAMHLTYDNLYRLWRADAYLAIKDLKRTNRSWDLVNKENLRELI